MNAILKRLRRHPFAVQAHFDRAVAVSFAFPLEPLRSVVSPGLEIDAYEGFGFVTVAMVWTRGLRPAGFPRWLGQDFLLAGYRVFTRLQDGPRRLRGLQILRSETDQRRMAFTGNLFTHYAYRPVRAMLTDDAGETTVSLHDARGRQTLEIAFAPAGDNTATLPAGSPFPDWMAARRFAGPMPFTFSAESERTFVVIEGVRQHWTPSPVTVRRWQVAMFDEAPFAGVTPILANAFAVHDVDYRWKRGRLVHRGGGEQ